MPVLPQHAVCGAGVGLRSKEKGPSLRWALSAFGGESGTCALFALHQAKFLTNQRVRLNFCCVAASKFWWTNCTTCPHIRLDYADSRNAICESSDYLRNQTENLGDYTMQLYLLGAVELISGAVFLWLSGAATKDVDMSQPSVSRGLVYGMRAAGGIFVLAGIYAITLGTK